MVSTFVCVLLAKVDPTSTSTRISSPWSCLLWLTNWLQIHVGANGATYGAQVFTNSTWHKTFSNNQVRLPPREPLMDDERSGPYFIVRDDALPLQELLMKPFPQPRLHLCLPDMQRHNTTHSPGGRRRDPNTLTWCSILTVIRESRP